MRYKSGTKLYFAGALSMAYDTTKPDDEDTKGIMEIEAQLHWIEYFSVSPKKN